MSAAVRLFSEQSGDVALEDVAREAGVSRQSVYLHFGSRTGLLLGLVEYVDTQGVLEGLIERVLEAPTASEALDEIAHLHAEYSPVAYPIARVFMTRRHGDDALELAWMDRMEARRKLYREVVERLVAERRLSPEWNVSVAAEVIFALTSWQVWEQLVVDQGWSTEDYLTRLRTLLRRALLAAGAS